MTKPLGGARIGGRYQLEALIGEGGMARVYRAHDLALDRQVALKELTVAAVQGRTAARALFEREFHTLTQLRHPHVIAVHDYGLTSERTPYYTMELLDGGDIGERAPMPWRQACRVMFEICSALALLHSRRVLHRDLSPRNIRYTRDGRAKLIDFGALVPMGSGGADIVGTPAFTAPETLLRSALDARTDLFSLGATLYFLLTRRLPFAARTFAELTVAWNQHVPPPSSLVPDVPAALDDLVLALINPEPSLRPLATFEVMQLLAACAGLDTAESDAVSRAYLVTPSLVGRNELLLATREKLAAATRSTGLLIVGHAGVGRSRFLDACSLEAQSLGFTILRASGSNTRAAFGAARDIATHLAEARPDLIDPAVEKLLSHERRGAAVGDVDAPSVQDALLDWLHRVAVDHPLFIAIDDAQRLDPPSAALFAALLDDARPSRLCIALTADSSASSNETLNIFARRCSRLELLALSESDALQLLSSLFGDVAHLSMLGIEIYRIARGNPRQTMDLAQWFLDRGVIRYAAGTWTLPERIASKDLPSSMAAALQARIETLSTNARFLAEALTLAYYEELAEDQCRALLPALDSSAVEQGLNELLWTGVVSDDGSSYRMTNRAWQVALLDLLSPAEIELRHRALAAMYEPRSTMATIHHAFAGAQPELGLTTMLRQHKDYERGYDYKQLLELNVGKMMWCAAPALETAQRLGYPPRVIHDMRRWHFAGNITVETGVYDESARLWFEQIAHDSGLALYLADHLSTTPSERLMRALTLAQQRYVATPEPQRVYTVEEAIRLLGEYVVLAIALGVRVQDSALIRSLPPILEPFVSLSPILDVLWKNALATMHSQCECRYEIAHELWTSVLARLESMTTEEFKHVHALRSAVVFALAIMDLQLGRGTANTWAERLDQDPYQRISALNIRKIECLEQGDRLGADKYRRQAEVLSLQMRSPQMFRSLLLIEFAACVRARDLSGIRHVLDEMTPLAARHIEWVPIAMLTEAFFHVLRGDLALAEQRFEICRNLCAPDNAGNSRNLAVWLAAHQGLAEVLLQTSREHEAHAVASTALEACLKRGIVAGATDLSRTLGLIEAKLGDARGAERIEAEIALLRQRGATGIRIGLSFEARAQIAIWDDDRNSFEKYAAHTAQEYRHGARSPLSARYARLLNEAARHGWQASYALSRLENFSTTAGGALATSELRARVLGTLVTNNDSSGRAQRVLDAVCAELECDIGHLYLLTDQALVLCASRGEAAPPSLYDLVQRWVELDRERARELDDLATGELLEGADGPVNVHTDHRSYELQPLRFVLDGSPTLAAVAAILVSEPRPPRAPNAALLQVLAEHLITGAPG